MFEESSPDVRLAADPLEAGADLTAQATQIVGRRVGQGRGIQVPPEVFQRIQLWGVRWQPLDAYFGDHDHLDRSIMITQIGNHDRSDSDAGAGR